MGEKPPGIVSKGLKPSLDFCSVLNVRKAFLKVSCGRKRCWLELRFYLPQLNSTPPGVLCCNSVECVTWRHPLLPHLRPSPISCGCSVTLQPQVYTDTWPLCLRYVSSACPSLAAGQPESYASDVITERNEGSIFYCFYYMIFTVTEFMFRLS